MKILITGGCGFIGSNFIRYLLNRYDDKIVNIDCLTYAGNLENLEDVADHPDYQFIQADVGDYEVIEQWVKWADRVVHFAAQTHVDRSILDPAAFIKTNIVGTYHLLEAIRANGPMTKRMIHVSTDEVYGSIEEGKVDEEGPLMPNSPYSATKAASDLLVRSYNQTYGLGIMTTRASNNFGPYQYPEKLIPLAITHLIEEKKIPIYGDGLQERDWIYVEDHCSALDLVLHEGDRGEIYNIASGQTRTNLEVVKKILELLGKSSLWMESVQDRPAHDLRYSLDNTKITKLGWKLKFNFEQALQMTLSWYQRHPSWWRRIKEKSKDFLQYYQLQYHR